MVVSPASGLGPSVSATLEIWSVATTTAKPQRHKRAVFERHRQSGGAAYIFFVRANPSRLRPPVARTLGFHEGPALHRLCTSQGPSKCNSRSSRHPYFSTRMKAKGPDPLQRQYQEHLQQPKRRLGLSGLRLELRLYLMNQGHLNGYSPRSTRIPTTSCRPCPRGQTFRVHGTTFTATRI